MMIALARLPQEISFATLSRYFRPVSDLARF